MVWADVGTFSFKAGVLKLHLAPCSHSAEGTGVQLAPDSTVLADKV